jgi:ABC-type dipeptide/oligopeptide/nickel transport system permease component
MRFLLRRLVGLLPVMAAALLVTFAALHALPGDPVAVMLSNHSADVQMANRLREE